MAERDAWIHMPTSSEADADGDLGALYRRLRDPRTGEVDNILRIHGQHPATLAAHYELYRVLMHGRSGLSRRQREMVAVVVSAINQCHC
ncbi:MAG: carboxymuconolactone decarboxylase family protein [Sporichthyaceae bacterium]|nr:carboxymuconolactone decarboxylase family protein [Sporichthyaceae bacterium]